MLYPYPYEVRHEKRKGATQRQLTAKIKKARLKKKAARKQKRKNS